MPPGTIVASGSLVSPGGAQGPGGSGMPVGTVIAYCGGGAPPAAFLTCDGSAVSRTTFPELYTAIGTTFGSGDGQTTFNLPDLRSRFVIGQGQGTGLTNRVLAAVGGEENHILGTPELPSHTHGMDHYHSIDFSQVNHNHGDNGHQHGYNSATTAGSTYAGGGGYLYQGGYVTGMGYASLAAASFGGGSSAYASATSAAWANTVATGGGGGHNNVPPFLSLVYIIKAASGGGATAQAPLADTTQNGLLRQLSGLTTDYVGGDNTCHPLSSLNVGFFNLTAAYTMALTDKGKYAICSGGSWTLTLPQAVAGLNYRVRNDMGIQGTTGIITIQPTSGTINGAASLALLAGQEIELLTDGTNWRGFGRQRDVIIGAVTFTNVASGSLLLPAGYDQFELFFSETLPSVTGGNVQMQLSNDGGNTWIAGTNYYCTYAYNSTTSAWAQAAQPALGFWYITHFLETIPRSYFKLQLHPGNANQYPEYTCHSTQYYATGGTPSQFILGGFMTAGLARANAASFNLNSGTITRMTVTVKGICII